MSDVYLKLAGHLSELSMGYPYSEALLDLLREMFTPDEAEIALAMPTNVISMVRRHEDPGHEDFADLHRKIKNAVP